ncbi:MAG: hypothetical protein QHG99_02190 [Methanomicrobiales archaeon]|nr:hypothetical protein [Methanomicrobiales archaeon]
MYVSLLLLIALIAFIAIFFISPPSGGEAGGEKIPAGTCGNSMISYINKYIATGTDKAKVVSVKEKNGIFEIITSYKGQNLPVYASTDCVLLFLDQPIDTTEPVPTPTPTPSPTPTPAMVNTERPTIDLYVMAFCPYGVQAENAMKSVVDLLGDSVDMKVRFIARVGGETPDTVNSLHGANEAKEDLRQVCIQKQHPDLY